MVKAASPSRIFHQADEVFPQLLLATTWLSKKSNIMPEPKIRMNVFVQDSIF